MTDKDILSKIKNDALMAIKNNHKSNPYILVKAKDILSLLDKKKEVKKRNKNNEKYQYKLFK